MSRSTCSSDMDTQCDGTECHSLLDSDQEEDSPFSGFGVVEPLGAVNHVVDQ